MQKDTYIHIGKIGSPYGIQGWLKVRAYTESQFTIFDYQPWYISTNGENWQLMEQAEGRQHGKGLIAKFPSIHTPEAARLLSGKIIAIPRSQLPAIKEGEYYWADLEGLTVINQHGKNMGQVSYLLETGAHDVLIIKGEKEFAIPYLPRTVVTRIDLLAKEIHINWED